VYLSDYVINPTELTLIPVPAWAQPKITYAMAIVKSSKNQTADQAYVNQILSPHDQAVFVNDGFLPLTAPVPSISRISETRGKPGSTLYIRGINVQSATSVRFGGGIAATFKVHSKIPGASVLLVTVPAKATTGSIVVTNPSGSAMSKVFTVT
jgi:hypothetical protein